MVGYSNKCQLDEFSCYGIGIKKHCYGEIRDVFQLVQRIVNTIFYQNIFKE